MKGLIHMYITMSLGALTLVLAVIDFIAFRRFCKKREQFNSTEATILEKKLVTNAFDTSNDENCYNLTLQYNVGNVCYEKIHKGFKSSYKVGDKIEILYNPNDPTKISVPFTAFVVPLVMTILCACSLVATIVCALVGV